ncbi:MAG: ABC transporter permease [Chloroflexi bacterium]|nr:ABC transporter permease [Chloroflexota bacterium]
MTKFLIRRLLQAIPTFIGITFIVFAMINLVPGGPAADLALDPSIKPEDRARIMESMGLNKPWWERYVDYVSGIVLRGDMGTSLIQRGVKVSELITGRLPNTLVLALSALMLSLAVSVPLGVLSAVSQHSLFDNVATLLSTVGLAVPAFWLGIMLIYLFAVNLGWFPTGGVYTLGKPDTLPDRLWHLVMPTFTLAFIQMAQWNRYIRASMLDVIRQDYVRTARAKGLRDRIVIFKHALRNALIPFATLLGLSLPNLVGGAVVIERIFTWPGIGRLAFDKAQERDYPVIMGVVMMGAIVVIIGNLAADIAYGFLDPRIKQD